MIKRSEILFLFCLKLDLKISSFKYICITASKISYFLFHKLYIISKYIIYVKQYKITSYYSLLLCFKHTINSY